MTLDSPALSTNGLTIGIGGHLIAKCDDLSLEPGKVLVLIGKNGSGKSTFLRTLGGFIKPLSGEVFFGDKLQKEVKIEKIAAWLSQEEHLEFAWSVREYVSLGRIAHNSGLSLTSADLAAVNEALEQTDAIQLETRFVNELSGGERQRVRVARALAQETPVVLMDEPTTHLDIEHQIQTILLIEKLSKQGKTVIVSLHDVSQAKRIGSKFLLFSDHVAQISDDLRVELLERTLGVQFEQKSEGSGHEHLTPIYCRTID